MKKSLCLVGLLSVFTGCATVSHNYTADVRDISTPQVGETITVYIGEHMLTQGKMITTDAVQINTENKVYAAFRVLPGLYVKSGEDVSYIYYKVDNSVKGAGSLPAILPGMPAHTLSISKKENKFCIIGYDNVNRCSKNLNYATTKVNIPKSDTFQQTLIYSGKIGNKINIGYREFSNDVARPAFNNDVEYDLSESKQIGYKGALLEILEANNQFIKFKLLKSFNVH